ncbi:MAG: AAA family ATPase [Deltaproteobacteria bacterium]|nr:AAA family ATPase [Deltaproteobacteria bacterium]
MTDAPLPVCRVAELEASEDKPRWLVESLWSHQAVGFLAGHPKLGKTWLALDLALSVATGTPCLDTFAVAEPGEVLIYLAEDPPMMVRQRLAGLCRHRGLDLDTVAVHVITATSLRLDLENDRRRLEEVVQRLKPRLLVLDPLVRLHRRDENHSGEISELLSFLRELQRAHALAVLVVHHMRKGGARCAGQALRGTGDLHAWIDSALYLQAGRGAIVLSTEHRAAPASDPIEVRLCVPRDASAPPYLEVVRSYTAAPPASAAPPLAPLSERLLALLRSAPQPLTRVELRTRLRVNNQRLGQTLDKLHSRAVLTRTARGWQIDQTLLPGETESGSAGTQPDEG